MYQVNVKLLNEYTQNTKMTITKLKIIDIFKQQLIKMYNIIERVGHVLELKCQIR